MGIRYLVICLCLLFGWPAVNAAVKPEKEPAPKPVVNPAQKADEVLKALDEYRFSDALSLADQYAKVFNAGAADTLPSPEDLRNRALMGTNMLERVQEIKILERFVIDAQDVAAFLNQKLGYPLLLDEEAFATLGVPMPSDSIRVQSSFLFPNRRTVLWSDPEGDEAALMMSQLLSNDDWDTPEVYMTLKDLFPDEEVGHTITSPFITQDGITLYFGADGPQSLGGLDIFMTRSDAENNDFLRPLNMGMPFNSPANDFLMAIDEQNGEGWWVSDRGMADTPDSVVIFRYKLPGETRVNHPADAPDLLTVAKGDSEQIPATDVELEDNEIFLSQPPAPVSEEIALVLADGTRITSADMVDTTVAKTAVNRYLDTMQAYMEHTRRVESLRTRYSTDKTVKDELLQAEQALEAERQALRTTQNAAIRAMQ